MRNVQSLDFLPLLLGGLAGNDGSSSLRDQLMELLKARFDITRLLPRLVRLNDDRIRSGRHVAA